MKRIIPIITFALIAFVAVGMSFQSPDGIVKVLCDLTVGGNSTTYGGAALVYNPAVDTTNYERISLSWSGSVASLKTEKGGTGANRDMTITTGSGNAGTLNIGAGGNTCIQMAGGTQINMLKNVIFGSDNANDIGAAGATRPRTIYIGTSILLGTNILSFSGTNLTWNGTAIIVP
jgi:hypothetical protein